MPAPRAVIVGHSERRTYHEETDADVRKKALAARRAGLLAIVCVGETRAEREAGRALAVVGTQLDGSLPDGATAEISSWPTSRSGRSAAGSPRRRATLPTCTASSASAWGALRRAGRGMRILYGGSVKPANAKELMGVAEVDGALVGGASLKADEFLAIAGVYR